MKKEYADIVTASFADVMHDCFMPYAEHVILERALPRVEDGLKPVQRRILFSMHEMNINPTAKHKKCATIVGDTMGKYHPHGDSSIYEALARMAQDFSMSIPLIDGQGNFGSIDGDGPAAMRYTEARMAPVAMEMLRDIEKDTVPFQLNFSDSMKEPQILPSRFPNILVNGASGIAVGLATNIPPHNLGEVIDGVVHRMKNPRCGLTEVMKYVKAPDFPTGGILLGLDELETAYKTGRGKITLRAKTSFETMKNGKTLIVITELPYEVRESAMLRKIQSLRETKKEMFAGIDAIRSETDRTGIRAVIELKKGVDEKKMLDCLFKYSDLQITYGINMVAIAEGQPKQLGLLQILDYYIAYQRKVVTRRVRFDIEQAQEREHRLAGLIVAVQNIDLVVKLIRSSANTREAKQKLMDHLNLTGVQAQAILDMRLAKLTQLEIDDLMREYQEVLELLDYLNDILSSREKLDGVIIDEIKKIKSSYSSKRRTQISGESAAVVIDMQEFKTVEDCVVIRTKAGHLKRMTPKAFTLGGQSGEPEDRNKPQDIIEATTADKLMLFTSRGNLFTLPVESIKEAKYKDSGSPLNSLLAGLQKDERIVLFTKELPADLLTVSEMGLLKITDAKEFDTKKKMISACGLRDKDRLFYAQPISSAKNLLLITKQGYSILIDKDEISKQGRTGTGVGGIRLGVGDRIVYAEQVNEDGTVVVFSDSGYAKKTSLKEYEMQGRNGKGQKTFLWTKDGQNGSVLVSAFCVNEPAAFDAVTTNGEHTIVASSDISAEPRYSNGMPIVFPDKGEQVKTVTLI